MVVGGADVFAGIQSGGQTGFAKQNHNYCQRAGKRPIEMISIESSQQIEQHKK
jgi:hypothetical protein